MLNRRWMRLLALLLGLSLVAAACGDDDDTATDDTEDATDDTSDGGEGSDSDFLACEVTDTGGVDDRSFNENAYNGLVEASEEIGFEPVVLESQSDADFEPNIQALIDQGCDLIVTVGFLLGDATEAAAQENTDTDFAIVDFAYETEYENVLGLTYATDQAAFLAGYVAAAQTQTGTVGTYGGLNIPTVNIFMKGFEAGIEYHNEQKGTDVQLVGWNTADDDGLFTGDFEDLSKGRQTTESLLDQGADIILPVAGPVGQGSVEAIRAGGDDAKLIWVDTDGCESVADACDLFLTSVMKNFDVSVYDAVTAAANGEFEGGVYSGTLENDGVELGPFNEFEGDISDELQSELDEIRAGIIDGSIATTLE
ncbi:BMP family ABC transporter substrate-binding protein [Acidimicrobiia bacterium EGI L10123]|uniref:BMP family lipoprotein n=1 Tax=Salinilacustrithrix flava TaxID=2957203 RepID=UPI003D7C1638|nr:BMP family ABC transporter substrate-binding protein [Acidimicrobiia bacterium EGI L10123]